MSRRIAGDDLPVRLIAPAFTFGVSDGQLNGTPEMRFSLIGRELANDAVAVHSPRTAPPVPSPWSRATSPRSAPSPRCSSTTCRRSSSRTGRSCRASIRRRASASTWSSPSSRPPIPTPRRRARIALHACPGQGSCGGMFTYNTMQTFFGVLGMEPLQMVAPISEDPRRLEAFPDQLVDCLVEMTSARHPPPRHRHAGRPPQRADRGHRHGWLDQRHAPQRGDRPGGRHRPLGRGTVQEEFNELSRRLPVLVDMRPFGSYSMVDVEGAGGLPAVVSELLPTGHLDGDALTCTGETLGEQVARLDPPPARPSGHPLGGPSVQGYRRPAPATGQPRPRRRSHPEARRRRGWDLRTAASPAPPACSTASGR